MVLRQCTKLGAYLRNVPVTHCGKKELITLSQALHRKCFFYAGNWGSRGEGREEKQREGLTSQQETGTMESPARIRHVALTDTT